MKFETQWGQDSLEKDVLGVSENGSLISFWIIATYPEPYERVVNSLNLDKDNATALYYELGRILGIKQNE